MTRARVTIQKGSLNIAEGHVDEWAATWFEKGAGTLVGGAIHRDSKRQVELFIDGRTEGGVRFGIVKDFCNEGSSGSIEHGGMKVEVDHC